MLNSFFTLAESAYPDQHEWWERWHSAGRMFGWSGVDQELVTRLSSGLFRSARPLTILDLGCGQCSSSIYRGNVFDHVIAVDWSRTALEKAQNVVESGPRVSLVLHDISKPMPFEPETIDGCMSHLTLHCFPAEVALSIVEDVRRVLVCNGVFAFSLKTKCDPYFGEGRQLTPDTFVRSGHFRRFYDTESMEELFKGRGWQLETFSMEDFDPGAKAPSSLLCGVARKECRENLSP